MRSRARLILSNLISYFIYATAIGSSLRDSTIGHFPGFDNFVPPIKKKFMMTFICPASYKFERASHEAYSICRSGNYGMFVGAATHGGILKTKPQARAGSFCARNTRNEGGPASGDYSLDENWYRHTSVNVVAINLLARISDSPRFRHASPSCCTYCTDFLINLSA